MAAVSGEREAAKADGAADSDSGSERDARDAEPMEVEEGELEAEDDVSVTRSLKELLPDTSRRYENKAGAFITGIDVNSKEAIERKEKRARRFQLQSEERVAQRNVCLDKDTLRTAIHRLRLEALHVSGVDDMSTQDIFGYFKEYPPAHIEWIDDASCNVVWLDDDTSVRVLINASRMPDPEAVATETQAAAQPGEGQEDEGEEVKQSSEGAESKHSDGEEAEHPEEQGHGADDLSRAERESLLRNEARPAVKPHKGNKLLLRFATHDDRKEPGAARRSRYYMKYGNPNYGGMRGILSNSWKRRFHTRRVQRDVIKSKKPLIGDGMGHTPPYTHRHSGDLVNLPEEPIKEEEEEDEEEEEQGDEDMDSDDRVVEYRERGGGAGPRGRARRSPSPWSETDEMDYDLELKMISTPSPKKSKKMTMYADELDTTLRGIRNRLGGSGSHSGTKAPSPPQVRDVRQLLEEKRHRQPPPEASGGKTDVRQRLGKRRRSPSPGSPEAAPPASREPIKDVHRRLGAVTPDSRGQFSKTSKDKKTGGLWSRLGSVEDDGSGRRGGSSSAGRGVEGGARGQDDKEDEEDGEEDDSTLQKMWGAMIKHKQELVTHKLKKSRLDNLPSLQIEISRDSSDESDA